MSFTGVGLYSKDRCDIMLSDFVKPLGVNKMRDVDTIWIIILIELWLPITASHLRRSGY